MGGVPPPPPPPPRATTTPPPPPQEARLPPRPSPRATLPLPPSSLAAAALRPGAQIFVPFAGDEQPPEFPLPRNREAQETRGRSPKDAMESTKRKESKVKQRKEKLAKQKGQRAPLQPVTEMNSGELPPPLPPSPPSVLVTEFALPSREEQETRGRSTMDAIESTTVGTTTTTSTRKQKDSRVQQRKEKLAKPLPQRPPIARPPPQPTSYSPDPKTAMAGQPHTLSPLEGAAEDTSISIGTDRGYGGASSDVYLSGTKRKEYGEKQQNEPQAKQLRSPAGLVSPRLISPSIGIRIMLSPRLISPSTTLANSTPGKKKKEP